MPRCSSFDHSLFVFPNKSFFISVLFSQSFLDHSTTILDNSHSFMHLSRPLSAIIDSIMTKTKNSQIKSSLLLLLASLVWGLAFVAQSVAGDSVGTFTFNGIRFIIGGLCLLPFLRGHNVAPSRIPFKKLVGGIICGTALFLASSFQQGGIALGADAGEA